jgi:2-haloacid dehalogenase
MSVGLVEAVAFDVNETLFSLDRLGPAFDEVGLSAGDVPLWFARVLREGFALAVLGGYREFASIAADVLRNLGPGRIGEAEVAHVLTAFTTLDPHPDAEPALRMLREAGVPAVTLTNGSAAVVEGLLERAGLAGYVEAVLSVEAVQRWKPHPLPYRHAAARLGLPVERVALVAAHAWDCAGARNAGMPTGWLPRREPVWPQGYPLPDVTGPDLTTVTRALLPGGG